MTGLSLCRWISICSLFIVVASASAQEAELNRFQADLSMAFFGSLAPVPDGDLRSHLGVAIVPPGEAWSVEPVEKNLLEQTPWGTSELAIQFNYPIEVLGGVARIVRQQRLEKLWQRVLSGSTPSAEIPQELTNSVLFRPTDRVDAARGISKLRQPSEAFLRYQEFSAAWRVLNTSNDASGAWRFHPRFGVFSSLEEARSITADEWIRFGYRVEVESAMEKYQNELAQNGWHCWLSAKTVFAANSVEVIPGVPAGRTTFFPREAEWQDTRSWNTVVFHSADNKKISCQLLRIRILRPWLEWTLVNDPQFRLSKASGLGVLCDGAVPTNATFATGPMANMIEELVLVRRIHGAEATSGHPLGRFEASNSDVPQLIAYVVRSLPSIASED